MTFLAGTSAAEVFFPVVAAGSGIDLELVAVGVLLVTLIVTSIVGNILVCIAVATDNNLRKLSNLFLVSLAIADLLVAGPL